MSLFDRYTVEDPPEEGSTFWDVYCSVESWRWLPTPWQRDSLDLGTVHRTADSAQRHSRAMLCADRLAEALEAMESRVTSMYRVINPHANYDTGNRMSDGDPVVVNARALLREIRGEEVGG